MNNARRKRNADLNNYDKLEQRQVMTTMLPGFAPDAGVLYQIHGVTGEQGQLSEIDLVNETFVDVGSKAGFKINGTGFRVDDGYVYGIKMDTDELIRIGSNGEHEILGDIDGLPNGSYYTGDFGEDGLLYLRHRNHYYGVNVDDVAVERVATATQDVTKTYDIAYNPNTGLHYSIRKVGQQAEFISIDLNPGSDDAIVSVINDDLKPAGTYGAVFSDASGRVFAANNAGGLYEIDLHTGVATFAGNSPRASSNDGAVSSAAYLDLPPVAHDVWMSILAGEPAREIAIDAPYDLEGQPIQISVVALPEVGQILDADGNSIAANQLLTIEELTSLQFLPPDELATDFGPVKFVYQVSDGSQIAVGQVEIEFAGLSRIAGQVVVVDDTEESSFAGYAFNNEIRLSGQDFRGNNVSLTVLTDVDGNFQFDQIAPGIYSVQQIQPPVVFDSYAETDIPDAIMQSNKISNIVVGAEPASLDDLSFYEFAPTLVSGFTYVDANANGQIDVAESGIGSVAIELSGIDFDGNAVSESTTTNSYGYYEFRGLAPGTYNVVQTQPESYLSAVSHIGEFGGQPGDNQIENIALHAGQLGHGYSFGEYESSSLAGNVFVDNDLDKSFDQGDSPLEGITVELSGTDFIGNQVFASATTNAAGEYQFDGLLAGTYRLTQIQPMLVTGTSEGFSHVGIFNNDEFVLASNGTAEPNQISGIEVGVGRHGRSFNFSESVDYAFARRFDQKMVFYGTDSADRFEFIAGNDSHTVIVNDREFIIDSSKRTEFVFDSKIGEDAIFITGSEKVEWVMTTGSTSTMVSENWKVHAVAGEHFVIDSGGGYDRAFMYDTMEDDRIKMTQDYSRMWNDSNSTETRGFHRSYAYAENGGQDRAYLYDSKYEDTVKMTSENARMISRKFYSFAVGFERVYAYSVNGGDDRAQFWDSEFDRDVFQAAPDFSRMYNDSFYNAATGFSQSDAFGYGGGENDRAYLFGSEGDELLVGSPRKTGMTGTAFSFDVHGFERTYAVGKGGNDRALLFDSKQDDHFVASPEEAKLYNDNYYLNAKGFSSVDAFSSSGGNDRAYFHDSTGDDTLIALENEMRLFGIGFDNTSHGFARAYAHSTNGGNDSALLYDTNSADTVKLGAEVSKMYGDTYYTWLNSFENVETRFSNASRHDRALVFGAVDSDTLAMSGELAALIYDHAAEFIYDADAENPDDQSEDLNVNSMYEDLINFNTLA